MSTLGLENEVFQLLLAEIGALWSGPCAPPLWMNGLGPEALGREQLSMNWTSPKPTLVSQLCEMQACDLSIVLEEKTIRLNERRPESQTLKKLLEAIPALKNLSTAETTLGDIQAAVSITKLRPGGLFWWLREQPLSHASGEAFLRFMLDRGQLLCEWDLSAVKHSLPGTSLLYPKYLYLFCKEVDLNKRQSHHPVTIQVQGSVRSHVEVPIFLEDFFNTLQRVSPPRGQWKVHRHESPSPQREWWERWPDSQQLQKLQFFERLRERSTPLGQLATIRAVANAGNSPHANETNPSFSDWRAELSSKLSWICLKYEKQEEGYRLRAMQDAENQTLRPDFLVFVSSKEWCAPLENYLNSHAVQEWIQFYAEKKQGKWCLKEQNIKFIPVLNEIKNAIMQQSRQPLPSNEPVLKELEINPSKALEYLKSNEDLNQNREKLGSLFVQGTHVLGTTRTKRSI